MKLHILSDLHVDLMRRNTFVSASTDADVVILAGDIHNGTDGITWARNQFPDQELIYVAGNHEYYGQTWSRLQPALRTKARQRGVHFLDKDAVELFGVRFLGATLWTDFDIYGPAMRERCMQEAAFCMSDYSEIDVRRVSDEAPGMVRRVRLSPEQTRQWFHRARHWLIDQLAEPFVGPTVVVTHHLPHIRSVAVRYEGDLLNGAFVSDLGALFDVPKLWVHGHTHDSMDYVESGVRVICNPRGYESGDGRWENAQFIEDLTIVVE